MRCWTLAGHPSAWTAIQQIVSAKRLGRDRAALPQDQPKSKVRDRRVPTWAPWRQLSSRLPRVRSPPLSPGLLRRVRGRWPWVGPRLPGRVQAPWATWPLQEAPVDLGLGAPFLSPRGLAGPGPSPPELQGGRGQMASRGRPRTPQCILHSLVALGQWGPPGRPAWPGPSPGCVALGRFSGLASPSSTFLFRLGQPFLGLAFTRSKWCRRKQAQRT